MGERVLAAGIAAVLMSIPAAAQAQARAVVSSVGAVGTDGYAPVELVWLNDAAAASSVALPARLEARLGADAVVLERVGTRETLPIAALGFVRTGYRVRMPAGGEQLALRVPEATAEAVAVALNDTGTSDQVTAAPIAGTETAVATAPAPATGQETASGESFLGGLSTYRPIYGAFGAGTNTNGKLQVSFKYQLFGSGGAFDAGGALSAIHFGYTQKMYWDLAAKSSPFRSVDYMPELFYLYESGAQDDGTAWGMQAGVRHESNGRSGFASRSLNEVYFQPSATIPVGGYALTLGPRAWFYIVDKFNNPDVDQFRGHGGLEFDLGKKDGFRLTSFTRHNFATGRGAVEGELSYPLNQLISTRLNLYLFAQGFTGWGENLFDYNVKTSRVRFGLGIVR